MVEALKLAGATASIDQTVRNTNLFYDTLAAKGYRGAQELVDQGIYPTFPLRKLDDVKRPIGLAKECGHEMIGQILKLQKYDVNKALSYVISPGGTNDLEHVEFFLAHGASHTSKTRKALLDHKIRGFQASLSDLEEYVTSKDDIPEDALSHMLTHKLEDQALFLISKGAKVTEKHLKGALNAELTSVALALLEAGVKPKEKHLKQIIKRESPSSGHIQYLNPPAELFSELIEYGAPVTPDVLVTLIESVREKQLIEIALKARQNKVDDLSADQKAAVLVWAMSNDEILGQKGNDEILAQKLIQ